MISSKRTTIASDTKANCQPGAAMVAGWGFAIAESMRNLGPLTLRDCLLPQRVIAKHQRGHCFYHRDSAREHTWIMPPTRGQFCFFAGCSDGVLLARDRRRRLKGDAKINLLTVGDSPLDSG